MIKIILLINNNNENYYFKQLLNLIFRQWTKNLSKKWDKYNKKTR